MAAVTLGETRKISTWHEADVALGGSVTKTFLPPEFQSAYGSGPLTAKVFLEVSTMQMWDF